MYTNDNITPFREIANIGKEILTKLTVHTPNTYIVDHIKDYSNCSTNCSFHKANLGAVLCPSNTYCKEYCDKVLKTVHTPITSSLSDETSLKHIPGRFTHSQILQFLYIHFLPGSGNIRPRVSISQTAEALGLCKKTVANNIKKFVIEDLIYATRIDSDTFSIYLIDAKNYHLKKNEGGSGYIPVSKELFLEMINIKNINSLKLEIRKLIKFDSTRINRYSTKKGAFSFKDIKKFLPGHINYRGIINKVIDGVSSIFEVNKKTDEDTIEFELKESYDARKLRESKKEVYSMNFTSLFMENAIAGVNQDITLEDLVQMSFEYGHKVVLAALKKYIKDYYWNNIPIQNIGAFMRSLIQKFIYGDINLAF